VYHFRQHDQEGGGDVGESDGCGPCAEGGGSEQVIWFVEGNYDSYDNPSVTASRCRHAK
jgi:hypothetical protein